MHWCYCAPECGDGRLSHVLLRLAYSLFSGISSVNAVYAADASHGLAYHTSVVGNRSSMG